MDSRFYEACNTTALLSLEKYGQEGSDLEALPEEARTLLQDKDTLLNAVQVWFRVNPTTLNTVGNNPKTLSIVMALFPSVPHLGVKQSLGVKH